jgi:hypothetical protein
LRPTLIESLETAQYQRGSSVEFTADRSAGGSGRDSHLAASTLEVIILDPLYDSDWERLVMAHPDSNFFHSAAWAKVLCKTYRHNPVYLRFSRASKLVALIPLMEIRSAFTGRRGVCLPFSDFCGPLMFDKEESGAVINRVSQLARERNWRYFEIRGGREALPANATPATQFYGHRLSLSDSNEELLARFGSAARRAIRKAERSGVDVEVARTRTAIVEFYRLHVKTRRRHGLPPQPLSFFLNIYEEIIQAGQGFVVLARSGSRLLAAAVFFQHGKTALYKFGASNEVFQKFRGNNLVMWEAIKFLIRDGCKTLHFGRTSHDNDGLRRFKAGWGALEETVAYFRFDTETEAWKSSSDSGSGFHNKVFRRLPLALNRLAGAVIYPHLD